MNIQSIIDRIAEAFSLFDFSYFISGTTSLSVLLTFMWYNGIFPHISLYIWILVPLLLVSVYVSGIVSMACGKWLRLTILSWKLYRKLFGINNFKECYTQAIKETKLDVNKLAEDSNISYTMMWTALKTNNEYASTVNFINKYWVTQALCEGLMATCLLAIAAVWITYFYSHWVSSFTGLFVTVLALGSFVIFMRYARQNAEIQIKEVVAAYSLMK